MAVTPEPGASVAAPRLSFADTLAVYLKRRVLIVLFLGFSSGLPLALSGSTLLVWMTEAGVNLGTIGLFALVGTPYTIKFLWAPLIDALDVPLLSRRFGRRRGWLLLSQFLLIAAIVFLGTLRSVGLAVPRRGRRAPGRHRLGDAGHRRRRVPGGKPGRKRASGRHGVLRRRLSHRHAGLDRGRAVPGQRLRKRLRLRPPRRLERRLRGHGVAGPHRHRDHAGRRRAGKIRCRQRRACTGKHAATRRRSGGRRVFRISYARSGFRRARLCRPVQVHRRAVRRHDRAVRDRSRIFTQRICGHHQGRRAGGDADRRLRRRLCGARLLAAGKLVDRRPAAGARQSRLLLAGASWATTPRG